MNTELVKKEIEDSINVKKALLGDGLLLEKVNQIAIACVDSLKSGGKIMFCGNGGSFADAQHLAAEFTSRFLFDRPALASIALGTNSSAMTAMGNDYGYKNVFSRELEAVAKPDDIFIAITTSGNSPNILKAVDEAKNLGIRTFVFTGESGGKVANEAECLFIPSNDTARIQ